jgi:type II secretory pathway pseudopilin PulG
MLNRLRYDESGITLTELMVAGAMAAIISAAFLLVFSSFNRSVSLEEARATALREVQAATSDLSVELRQAIPLTDGSFAVASLEASWPAPELVFYSDRAREAAGPERYRYYVSGCSGNLCDLMREVTIADAGGPPWTFTGTANTKRVVANLLSNGDPLFQGADWSTGSEVLTTSCGTSAACDFSLVQISVRVDPDPKISAEEPLKVRREVRLRNAP